ncbi:Ion transporter [Leptolyngbya sp. 'hensonii']|uniref:ion transporter n=1 Tax=Leptolyngbya sp. 'hensonii' TaxID=1922337 RepID=UPI0009500DB8|nr:ion transporter [Leptolyngbya sp. 'hensonii']OLP18037.1 Ion transporter [Leptolyngbya sp. 'hensonii']
MLRQKLTSYLEDIDTSIGKVVNLSIAGLVLLSSLIFVAETYPITRGVRQVLDTIDLSILILFGAEYLLRLWCAEKRLRYFFSLYSLIDLLAILPFLLGAANISFVRVLRWFRILKLIRLLEGRTLLGYVSSDDGFIFTRILFTLFAIVFVYSGLIYQVEHPANPSGFNTFLDAVYFSIATMTTVGFGDIAPVSQVGRLLAVSMILTGVALIPWQVGDLIKRLARTSDRKELPCSGCGLFLHDTDARFCKNCGTALKEYPFSSYPAAPTSTNLVINNTIDSSQRQLR